MNASHLVRSIFGVSLLAVGLLVCPSRAAADCYGGWFYSGGGALLGGAGIQGGLPVFPGIPVNGPQIQGGGAMIGGGPGVQGGVPGAAAFGGGQRFSNPAFGGFILFPMSPRFPLVSTPANFSPPVNNLGAMGMPMGGFGMMPMGGFFIPPGIINLRNPPAGFGMKGGFGGFGGGGYGL